MPHVLWVWLKDRELDAAALSAFEAGGAGALAAFLAMVGVKRVVHGDRVEEHDIDTIPRSMVVEFFRELAQ